MNELPAPIAGAKGRPQIHDPRLILKKEREAMSSVQKGEIQLRVELPQRLQALEARLTALESSVTEQLEQVVRAIERIESSSAHVEVDAPRKGGWPKGKPRSVQPPPDDTPDAG